MPLEPVSEPDSLTLIAIAYAGVELLGVAVALRAEMTARNSEGASAPGPSASSPPPGSPCPSTASSAAGAFAAIWMRAGAGTRTFSA
ncbi:MAG: hypothetical protein U9Q81_12855 [Pseudomonadota bacterium]|nr:hypothetical protein [Pseudomonadota bacterium]